MKNRSTVSFLALLVALSMLSACGPVNVTCGSDGFTENSSTGKAYSWKDGSTLQYRFAEDVPESLRSSITSGADAYNEVFQRTRISFSSNFAPAQNGRENEVSGDGINGIYIIPESDWFFDKSNPGAVAVTNNIYSQNEILETDVFYLVKDSAIAFHAPSSASAMVAFHQFTTRVLDLFSFVKSRTEDSTLDDLHGHTAMALVSTEGIAASGMYSSDFETVKAKAFTVHELGHSLGRCHTQNKDSIMQPTLSTSVYNSKPFLSDFDLDVLAEHYSLSE